MGSSFDYTLDDLYDDTTFAAGTGRNHVNITPEGKAMPLRTTLATDPEPQRSLSTWTYSDILQGSANIRPQGAIYDVFNQTLSNDLATILQREGGAEAMLGGKAQFAPYDVIAAAGNVPSGTTIERAIAQGEGLVAAGGSNVRTEPSVNGTITVADVIAGDGSKVTVAQRIAGSVQQLFDAAKMEGIILAGWGYRSHQRQIELRTKNGCPNVWKARPSDCRVPTAIPGTSNHESGLAIDFTQNGSTLSRSSSGFAWMEANAHKFGLKNLPSEAWHWSTTGG